MRKREVEEPENTGKRGQKLLKEPERVERRGGSRKKAPGEEVKNVQNASGITKKHFDTPGAPGTFRPTFSETSG
jgi:hypothetical protein